MFEIEILMSENGAINTFTLFFAIAKFSIKCVLIVNLLTSIIAISNKNNMMKIKMVNLHSVNKHDHVTY